MAFLTLRAYLKLISFEFCLRRNDFRFLYEKVRNCSVTSRKPSNFALEHVCAAIETACIWYWKEALCLQRSAATACLLKSAGIPAEMIIAAQVLPFRAHAWVEVDGHVVNDRPYISEVYPLLLDRC